MVALRFVLGAHFFHEGYTKYRDPKPFSGPFFSQAKGPFADFFTQKIWDRDGLGRLDRQATADIWSNYVVRATTHFGFNDEQVKQADELLTAKLNEFDAITGDYKSDIDEYEYGLERRDKNADDPARTYMQFQKHDARIATELMPKRMAWQGKIDKLWRNFEQEINALASPDLNYQADATQEARGYLRLQDRPGRAPLDSEQMDQIVPWVHMTVGVLLVIGLFTRIAALVAAAFLASVVASQWPFTPGTIPTNYQQVEMCAALVLAAIGAGNYAGFDILLKSCCCGSKCDPAVPVTHTINR